MNTENQTLLDKAKTRILGKHISNDDLHNEYDIYKAMDEYAAYFASENNGLKWVEAENKPNKTAAYIVKNESGDVKKIVFAVPESPINEIWYSFKPTHYLSECSPVNEQREKELESLSDHNRAIIKDLNDQRIQLTEKDTRIKQLELVCDTLKKERDEYKFIAQSKDGFYQPLMKESPPLEFGHVYKNKQGVKRVVSAGNVKQIKENPDQWEFVCEKPHEDGDFSYLCGFKYCRCCD